MSSITSIKQIVLTKVAPNKVQEETLQTAIDAVTSKLATALKKHKITAEVFVGGSIAKGTFFVDKTDVDIFIRFDYKTYKSKSNSLSDLLEPIVKEVFSGALKQGQIERLHGSRDYFQVLYKQPRSSQELELEIVPILNINESNQAVNLTDVTPLHVTYINKHATQIQKQDIRLAKQFAKANGCYGAESYIGGFSGYVLEILTTFYGSFEELLKASLKWKLSSDPNKKKTVIDPSKFHQGKLISFEIDVSKLQSPIVVVDPVDKWRNAAAALTLSKVKQFQKAAKTFLTKPNASIFEKEKVSYESLTAKAKQNKYHLLYLNFTANEGKQDVVGCQILKAFEYLLKELTLFTVKQGGWTWDKNTNQGAIYYFFKQKRLPKTYKIQGPPVTMESACKAFQKAHDKNKQTVIKQEQGKLIAIKEYKERDLGPVLNAILKKAYLKDKLQEFTDIRITFN